MEQTRREKIAEMLKEEAWSLLDLAKSFSEHIKVIEDDIVHIRKSLSASYKLKQVPAKCEICDYAFKERKKLKKPSRCPKCKSERIGQPLIELIKR